MLYIICMFLFFFFSSRRRHTRYIGDWSSDVCSSDLFVSLRRLRSRRQAEVFPARIGLRTNRQRNQNREHHEQRLGRPVRKKNFQKQTSHEVLLLASRGRAKIYPAPRTVLMCSVPPSVSPSFFRTLLTCISMLRSKGENLRAKTALASRSRVTTRTASRNTTCSRLNST